MTREVAVHGRGARLRLDGSRAEYAAEGADAIAREFTVSSLGPGSYLITLDARSYRVALGPPSEAAVNGRVLRVAVFDPRDRRAGVGRGAGSGREEIAAPMPGKVIRVLVTVGEAIAQGQGLIVVEAMKMQNEMKSPRAGQVAEVRATDGATVTAGQVLVVVE